MGNAKQEKKLRKLVRKSVEGLEMNSVNILNGIKESWSDDEKDVLINWLKDPEAKGWGE